MFLILFFSSISGYSQSSAWYNDAVSKIENTSSLPPQERIPILSQYLTVGGFTGKPPTGFRRNNVEDQQVFEKAQSALLVIPGHAEFFMKPIEDTYERLAQNKFDTEPPKIAGDLVDVGRVFQMLSQLPSPETVKVLGEFMVNDKVMDAWMEETKNVTSEEQHDRLSVNPPLGPQAAYAINFLPLKSKPVKEWDYSGYDDVRKWRNWYQQIKDGRVVPH